MNTARPNVIPTANFIPPVNVGRDLMSNSGSSSSSFVLLLAPPSSFDLDSSAGGASAAASVEAEALSSFLASVALSLGFVYKDLCYILSFLSTELPEYKADIFRN